MMGPWLPAGGRAQQLRRDLQGERLPAPFIVDGTFHMELPGVGPGLYLEKKGIQAQLLEYPRHGLTGPRELLYG